MKEGQTFGLYWRQKLNIYYRMTWFSSSLENIWNTNALTSIWILSSKTTSTSPACEQLAFSSVFTSIYDGYNKVLSFRVCEKKCSLIHILIYSIFNFGFVTIISYKSFHFSLCTEDKAAHMPSMLTTTCSDGPCCKFPTLSPTSVIRKTKRISPDQCNLDRD